MRNLLLICCCFGFLNAKGQAYYPGDWSLSAGIGSLTINFDVEDTAGFSSNRMLYATQIPLHTDYALTQHLGIDFSFAYASFGKPFYGRFEKHSWVDFGLGMSYHWSWFHPNLDFSAEAEFGLIMYNLYESDTIDYSEVATCLYLRPGLNPRFYLTQKQHLGVQAYYRFSRISGQGYGKDPLNYDWRFFLKGFTHAYGVGLFYRFGFNESAYLDNVNPTQR